MKNMRNVLKNACWVVVAAFADGVVVAGQEHVDFIRDTPCLEAYRVWSYPTFERPGETFDPPAPFTAEQCARAKLLNIALQEDLRREAAARDNTNREEFAADTRAKFLAQTKVEQDRERENQRYERLHRAQLAKYREQAASARTRAAELARRPGVKLGMSTGEVVFKTNWGSPRSKKRVTTATGVQEHWYYGGGNRLVFLDDKVVIIEN